MSMIGHGQPARQRGGLRTATRLLTALSVALVAGVIAPALASAATVTLIGSIGSPALVYNAAAGEENNPRLVVDFGGRQVRIVDPDLTGTPPADCVAQAQGYVCTNQATYGVIANLGDEDDTLSVSEASGSVVLTVDAGDDADTISGGSAADTLRGDSGDDTVSGGNGDDTVSGGSGDDTVSGGAGSDTVEGEDQDDVLRGGVGADTLRGGNGADQLFGEEGGDSIDGGTGFDRLEAGDGGPGTDTLLGGLGNDELGGGSGADTLGGGDGSDELNGRGGNDTLDGGPGGDDIRGDGNAPGAGVDTLDYTSRPAPLDVTLDGLPGDGEAGEGDDVAVDVENVLGGAGADRLVGPAIVPAANTFNGGPGDDRLDGGAGGDLLVGDKGDDRLLGGAGPDTLQGGLGRDVADYSDRTDPLQIVLDGLANDGGENGGSVGDEGDNAQVEDVLGGSGTDRITGNGLANAIDGGPGADGLSALGGDDTVISRDGSVDDATCGNGADSAEADREDVVADDCEQVLVPPLPPQAQPTVPPALGAVSPLASATEDPRCGTLRKKLMKAKSKPKKRLIRRKLRRLGC